MYVGSGGEGYINCDKRKIFSTMDGIDDCVTSCKGKFTSQNNTERGIAVMARVPKSRVLGPGMAKNLG